MAISIIGTPQTSNTNNGGTTTCTFDTRPSEGDYTVVVMGNPSPSNALPVVETAGYTLLSSHAGAGSDNPSIGVWYKKQGATTDTSVSGNANNSNTVDTSMIAFVLRGVDGTTFSDATPTTAGETTSTTPDPAASVEKK